MTPDQPWAPLAKLMARIHWWQRVWLEAHANTAAEAADIADAALAEFDKRFQ